MLKLMLGSALALAAMGVTVARADGLVVSDGQIAQFKAVLKLTAEQERYWVAVEATWRDINRRQNATAATLDDASLKRLLDSAMPLYHRLDADQKRDLKALARSLGVFSLATVF